MASEEEMLEQVLGVKHSDYVAGDDGLSYRDIIKMLCVRIWKLEARLAKVEGRL